MRERPIVDLIDALLPLGAKVHTEQQTDCPPVVVDARGLDGGMTSIRGDVSSQYLSALLMAAPYAKSDVEIQIVGPLVSQPYVDMTVAVMDSFAVQVSRNNSSLRIASGQKYRGRDYQIEPDASAASYFWGAAAVLGGSITVAGLGRDSLQGDVGFCDCLRQMGCQVEYVDQGIRVTGAPLHGITIDMNAISDTVQTLAAVALFADGPTRITGVGHIRHKETDRIGNLAVELRKLGAHVEEFDDGLEIRPGELKGTAITTYDDHRMAMSLSLVGLRVPDVVILDPGCTSKTYPSFFSDLDSIARA
jgi:3-phosphoshikimate 1-carboxyvinyltransferase